MSTIATAGAIPTAESAFLTPPLPRASRKMSITAGRRGGLNKIASRSLPKPESGRDGQPKFIAKKNCYLQFHGRGGRI
jgi:hypothetical protein